MKLHLAAVRVFLSFCSSDPRTGRHLGLTFTPNGVPGVAVPPCSK